MKGMFHII